MKSYDHNKKTKTCLGMNSTATHYIQMQSGLGQILL